MTRQDIADYLGLTTETVSSTLSPFERDALIARPTGRRIILRDPAALRDLSTQSAQPTGDEPAGRQRDALFRRRALSDSEAEFTCVHTEPIPA